MTKKIILVGIGNKQLGDDAVGLLVAEKIKRKSFPDLRVVEDRGEGFSLMEIWKGYDLVIIIDAVSSNSPAGTIHQIEAHKKSLPTKFLRQSTHAFGVGEAIEIARSLKSLPKECFVFGIEGKNFGPEDSVSREVEKSVDEVIEKISDQLSLLTRTQ